MHRTGIDHPLDTAAIGSFPDVIGPDDVGLQDVIPCGLIPDGTEVNNHIRALDHLKHRVQVRQIGLHIAFTGAERAHILSDIG